MREGFINSVDVFGGFKLISRDIKLVARLNVSAANIDSFRFNIKILAEIKGSVLIRYAV